MLLQAIVGEYDLPAAGGALALDEGAIDAGILVVQRYAGADAALGILTR